MRSLFSRLGSNSAASLLSWPVLLASIAASAVVIGVQQLGALEEAELNFFDQLVRLQPDQGPDPRLLVVTVTEEDIQNLGKWPTDDQTLDKVFDTLEQYQPRVIGLDIYRDLPVEPGNIELATRMEVNDNIIAVCKVGDAGAPGVPPPPTVPESRVGFSDVVVDPSGIVRRNLLTQTPDKTSKCAADQSFSLQLALHYLEKQGIQQQLTEQNYLQLGSTIFKPIEEDTAGYQNIDARGYQVLLNYRSPSNIARLVTLKEVLNGSINPSSVKDRIVLIGVTAPSVNDYFYTPFSKGQQQDLRMPGVVVHAQMVSQILSAVLDKRALIWFWPGWVEASWILVWSLVGAVLAWGLRQLLLLVLAETAALVGLVGICYVIFIQQGWVPLLPPALALLLSGAGIVCYRGIQQEKPFTNLSSSSGKGNVFTSTNIPNAPLENAFLLLDGRYKIIEDIGSGGFGKTFLAEDTKRPGRPYCVVKQLKPARTDEKFLELAGRLFYTEAVTLEQLGSHDQIPQLLAKLEENGEFYLVQEFIKGHPLSKELTQGQHLLESQVVELLKDVLGILVFIHKHGVIHRDIKPDNIMRRERDGRLVLIDFGAVKEVQTKITLAGKNDTVSIGTLGYAASEQLRGEPVPNSDIYSLGIIGIQAVTGLVPTQLHKDPITHAIIWRNYAQVSSELAAILDKMVRYESRERYQSATEVLQAFAAFLE